MNHSIPINDKENIMSTHYNGWTNYDTWNVALWIQNDEGLYITVRAYSSHDDPYPKFVGYLKELGITHTPDGVSWTSPDLNVDELNECIRNL